MQLVRPFPQVSPATSGMRHYPTKKSGKAVAWPWIHESHPGKHFSWATTVTLKSTVVTFQRRGFRSFRTLWRVPPCSRWYWCRSQNMNYLFLQSKSYSSFCLEFLRRTFIEIVSNKSVNEWIKICSHPMSCNDWDGICNFILLSCTSPALSPSPE